MRSSYAKQRLNERLQGMLAELQAAEVDVPKACNRQSPRVVAVRGCIAVASSAITRAIVALNARKIVPEG